MPDKNRAVFIKLSGERLSSSSLSGTGWDPKSVKKVVANLSKIYKERDKLDLEAITLVSGAGNLARGDNLKAQNIAPEHADVIGRAATILNTIVLADVLTAAGVPCEIFIASKMSYKDSSIKTNVYSPNAVIKAHSQGKVVLIGGGTGDDNVTTDNAVVLYASDYKKHYKGEVLVLKSTKFDGVFDSDPKTNPKAARYKEISAHDMLADYDRFKVVDKQSLKSLADHKLTMTVYSEDKHDLNEVLSTLKQVGTKILPSLQAPVLYR